MSSRKNSEKGFTLVEIAIAIAILGVALTTLIGMQTRVLDIYLHERNQTRAALYGQYLMTMIEIETDPPEVGNTSEDLEDKLREVGYFDKTSNKEIDERDEIEGWTVEMEVESIDVRVIEDALRRIDLTIRWGEGEFASYKIAYFMITGSTKTLAGVE